MYMYKAVFDISQGFKLIWRIEYYQNTNSLLNYLDVYYSSTFFERLITYKEFTQFTNGNWTLLRYKSYGGYSRFSYSLSQRKKAFSCQELSIRKHYCSCLDACIKEQHKAVWQYVFCTSFNREIQCNLAAVTTNKANKVLLWFYS